MGGLAPHFALPRATLGLRHLSGSFAFGREKVRNAKMEEVVRDSRESIRPQMADARLPLFS
jgi:hypothetical protein